MNVLVAGGAGYIGSHAVKQLLAAGHRVTVVDNLFRGHRQAVDRRAAFQPNCPGRYRRPGRAAPPAGDRLRDALRRLGLRGRVGDRSAGLLRQQHGRHGQPAQAMKAAGVKRMVFSSTCATYGEPEAMPIVETMRQQPISPYGWSKWCVERMLRDYAAAEPGFRLRRPALFQRGRRARPTARWARTTEPETHLIPVAVAGRAWAARPRLTVFGTDYPTPDGTCIRDYVHVEDLCAAHIAAMEALRPGDARFYNLGIGRGYSVNEVIEAARRVTGHRRFRSSTARAGPATRLFSTPTPRRFAASWAGRPSTLKSSRSWPRPGTGFAITPMDMAGESLFETRSPLPAGEGRTSLAP